ncbi:MAG: micrococcal nuclease-like protein nuclease [Candidatus Uhrbacteria bacterium GW2011_GWF2_41_16]|uniref:Micrococcal nuclease-like protein nuclease n=1 Tax=Candidatus Uhrbacteria bacterium GW2011_GWF2_41_16 TaxID=1618997 RepID=A0A0G0XP16_9BACT|nr:MAG: micrococcal nuclease-like protein nuclease [Candidatus Uhrbacteria bacterium GW2011_GWA2_41_10]KKR98555.1 MAG: micrococcal nuclease-like protein nuclease [Candidatus Uhrbacteria bacterium GW2011_GWF2_41_16]
MKGKILFLFLAGMLCIVQSAQGQLDISFEKGKHVYFHPEGWTPPGSGYEEIEQATAKGYHPFYAIFLQNLPGEGNASDRIKQYIADLELAWAKHGFDSARSSVMLVVWNDACEKPKSQRPDGTICKYELDSGVKWRGEPAHFLPARDHETYTKHFVEAVRYTPPNPAVGVLETLTSLDIYLRETTDPTIIAARQKAAEQEREQLRIAHIRSNFDYQIAFLGELLNEDKTLLPTDLSGYRNTLAQAKEIRARNDLKEMDDMADSMTASTDQLSTLVVSKKTEVKKRKEIVDYSKETLDYHIEKMTSLLQENTTFLPSDISRYQKMLGNAKDTRSHGIVEDMDDASRSLTDGEEELFLFVHKQKEEAAALKRMETTASIVFLLFSLFAFFGLGFRHRNFKRMRQTFEKEVEERERKIRNASGQYLRFHEERDEISALMKSASGREKELLDSTTAEVDAIYVALRALETHLAKCKTKAIRSSFWNLTYLREALADLETEFEFDTGEINKDELFGQETKIVKVNPVGFEQDLTKRFRETQEDWNLLKQALAVKSELAEQAFPHRKLDELFAICDTQSIPHQWLSKHPLAGDRASDERVYEKLNTLRLRDAVTYVEHLQTLRTEEMEMEAGIHQIVAALQEVQTSRIEIPELQTVIEDPNDDPAVTFRRATQEEEELQSRLAAADTVAEIEVLARRISERYRTCAKQIDLIRRAIDHAEKSIADARTIYERTGDIRSKAQIRETETVRVHTGCRAAESIADGDKSLESGTVSLSEAEQRLRENKHLSARRSADKALDQFKAAEDSFAKAIRHCDTLDAKKVEYERKMVSIETDRETCEQQIRGYGTDTTLNVYRKPVINGPADYNILLDEIERIKNGWRSELRRAREVYEERERQRREHEEMERHRLYEEEQRRRRIEEEAEWNRQTFSSSWNSSTSSPSSSSWSHSGNDSGSGYSSGGSDHSSDSSSSSGGSSTDSGSSGYSSGGGDF